MVTASDDLRTILELDAVGGLDDAPVRQHACAHVPAIPALPLGPIDGIPWLQLRDRTRRPVGHEDWRIAGHAVGTSMLAAAIRIDRLLEGNIRGIVARDDRACRLGAHLGCDRVGQLVAIPAVVDALGATLEVARRRIAERAATAIAFHGGYCTSVQFLRKAGRRRGPPALRTAQRR